MAGSKSKPIRLSFLTMTDIVRKWLPKPVRFVRLQAVSLGT